jgi:hypothetical protein
MILKINNDEIVKVDQIIKEEMSIKGYIHGKKTVIFEIHFSSSDSAKQAMVAITESLKNSNFVDINSIYYQFK